MTQCSDGSVNGHKVMVMRDTGSITCVVKHSLVETEQMPGNHELCMLIDCEKVPMAVVKINTPYYTGTVKALCMENPVQELIIENMSGATGVEASYEGEVTEQSEVINDEVDTQPTEVGNEEIGNFSENHNVVSNAESSEMKEIVIADEENHCASVQTKAMKAKECKPQKPLKVTLISLLHLGNQVTMIQGLDIGPEQLIEQQKADQTLKRYWELVDSPVENGKA